MNTANYTPGPWIVVLDVPGSAIGYRAIVANNDGEPGEVICNPSPMGAANAALIAEAPNLLVALQGLVADWERVMGRPIPDDHEAKAAIRAATGGGL